MGIVSRAQNFEDVILWRALQHVANGFYIDVGAHHPVHDSVSRAFYEHGWRGVHVEPVGGYADLLRADRPDEVVIQAAVGARPGTLRLFEILNTGMTTAVPEFADMHRGNGFASREIEVPAITLDDVFAEAGDREIHWLKIDVEGLEGEVLAGWRDGPRRPWIVVIECTFPNSTREIHQEWEPLILDKGYTLVYRDGLNRFYLSDAHPELRPAFELGPNYFDGFQLTESQFATVHFAIAHQQRIAELGTQLQQLGAQLEALRTERQQERAAREAAEQAAAAARAEADSLRATSVAADLSLPLPGAGASVDELLALPDRHFVRAAYLALLGREPDPEGARHYLRQLRAGADRRDLLARLSDSEEGRAKAADVPGLDRALRRLRLERIPFVGRLFRASPGTRLLQSALGRLGELEQDLHGIARQGEERHARSELRWNAARQHLDARLDLIQAHTTNHEVAQRGVEAWLNAFGEEMRLRFTHLQEPVGRIEQPLARVEGALGRVEHGLAGVPSPLGRIEQSLGRTEQALDRIGSPLGRIEQSVERLGPPLGRIQGSLEGLGQPLGRIQQSVEGLGQPLGRIEQSVDGLGHPLGRIEQSVAGIGQPLARIEGALDRVEQPLARMEPPLARMEEALGRVEQPLGRMEQVVGRVEQVLERVPPGPFLARAATPPLPVPQAPAGTRSERTGTIYFSVGDTIASPGQSGAQRVARQLARALLETGRHLVFVKWHPGVNGFVPVDRADLEQLARWDGPALDPAAIEHGDYPHRTSDAPPVPVVASAAGGDWLLLPEGSSGHGRQHTLDVILAARRANLKTAFLFQDAIALRRPELAPMAEAREASMRQLLQADVVLPISQWAARDLGEFLRHHELAATGLLPRIDPVLLPAEVRGEARVTERSGASSRRILCTGGTDPCSNLVPTIRAFADLVRQGAAQGWTLEVAGDLQADDEHAFSVLAAECPQLVRHPDAGNASPGRLYADCEFTVFAGTEDAFARPVADSLWNGKPCLCANFGPMVEVARRGGCLAVDMRNPAAIAEGLRLLLTDAPLRERLAQEAMHRPLLTWAEYAAEVGSVLDAVADPLGTLGNVYYMVDHTAVFAHQGGVERVVRSLAAALLRQGVRLIPARWSADRTAIVPASAADLKHLAHWNGPRAEAWTAWQAIAGPRPSDWVLFPELTSDYGADDYLKHRRFLDAHHLRGAWIFYDAIPWKLRSLHEEAEAAGHRLYLAGINRFELILPISHASRDQLEIHYLGERTRTVDLAHRLRACPLPGEFPETPRVLAGKAPHDGAVHVLAVGPLSPGKNHVALVKAFLRASARSRRPMRLTLAGSPSAQAIADEVGALIEGHPNIRWIRSATGQLLDALYDECDFTVDPSYEAGFGLPVLESLWHARPCVCMNAGAMAEVAAGGGCITVDTANVAQLAKAMVELAEDPLRLQALAQVCITRPVRTWDDYARDVARHLAGERLPALLPEPPADTGTPRVLAAMPNLAPRPLLSACISTYNRAHWLRVSLPVLLREAAGLEADIEVLVCDNASTDDTPDVVAPDVAAGRVRYVRNAANVGMLGNLRVTAQEARGKFVWILGDDDLLKPGALRRALEILRAHPEIALLYTNYAYTLEDDPTKVTDVDRFLADAHPIALSGGDALAPVRVVAGQNENFFTAIYCVVFQRTHALLAYSQFTEGEPFSSLPTCVPTTNHVLRRMMELPAFWNGQPLVVVNMNVSWMKYAWRWILERFPEIHDVAVRHGADPDRVDVWRDNYMPAVLQYLTELLARPGIGVQEGFDVARLIADLKHTAKYAEFEPQFSRLYTEAFHAGHPLARRHPDTIFLRN